MNDKLMAMQSPCLLCPRECKAERTKVRTGYCKMTDTLVVSSVSPHFGEESVLVGTGGSGTIFLSGCNLLCVFCQNYDISHQRYGEEITIEDMVDNMFRLKSLGCHNVNFVTPTHFAPQIAESISIAKSRGLEIPVVYNCGGYESLEVVKELNGLIDIYMPDVKFLDAGLAKKYLNAEDYPEIVREVLIEMRKQVGDLHIRNGIAERGLLIRHLVMPGCVKDSKKIIDFIHDEISRNAFVNVMEQYRPVYRAMEDDRINRRIKMTEYQEVYDYARCKGLRLSDWSSL